MTMRLIPGGQTLGATIDGPTAPALQPGDLVEAANDAIGVLANRVVRGTPP